MKKIKLIGMTSLAAMTLLAGCDQLGLGNSKSDTMTPSAAIATIGDKTITQDQLYQTMKASVGVGTLRTMILTSVLEQSVPDTDAIKQEIDETVDKQIEQVGGEEAFKQFLAAQKISTVADYRQSLYTQQLFRKLAEREVDQSDAAIQDYYDNKYSIKMEAQHILVKTEEEANAILDRLRNGETFEDLAKENSIDGSAANGGRLSPFTTGQMIAEFENAVKEGKNGEVIQAPVQSKFGYHIIKVINNGQEKPALDTVKDTVKEEYLSAKINDNSFTSDVLSKLIKEAKIDIKEDDLKPALDELLAIVKQAEEAAAAQSSAQATSETAESAAESSSAE